MNKDRFNQSIGLRCSTCGNDQFEYDEVGGKIETAKCTDCKRVFSTEELIAENGELIDLSVARLADDVADDLRKAFRRTFRTSRNIRIK